MKINRNFINVFVVLILINTSCSVKNKQEFNRHEITMGISGIDKGSTMNDLFDKQLNLYHKGFSINYYESNIEDIRKAIGNPSSIESTYNDPLEKDLYRSYIYDGIKISYNEVKKRIEYIIITSNKFSVEKGLKIGDIHERVIIAFPKGFYKKRNNEEVKDTYFYVKMNDDCTLGTGYKFRFNQEKQIESIVIGIFAFQE